MFNGKMKAITFSFDDASLQDRRLVELFNQCGLKGTFNVNSGLLGMPNRLLRCGVWVDHSKIAESEVRTLYAGHEVAVHTLSHPPLNECNDAEVIRQVEEDRLRLSELAGYEVVGMAYPCSTAASVSPRVKRLLAEHTGVRYARTTDDTHAFDSQTDLLQFNPTIHHFHWNKLSKLADRFLALQPETPQLFYIWGHGFEFDIDNSWEQMEEFCRKISGKEDVFYGTNRQVFGV